MAVKSDKDEKTVTSFITYLIQFVKSLNMVQ